MVDCDPSSSTYGGVVGWAELPTAGNELHHFGWNACSSALCHDGHGGHHADDPDLEQRITEAGVELRPPSEDQ